MKIAKVFIYYFVCFHFSFCFCVRAARVSIAFSAMTNSTRFHWPSSAFARTHEYYVGCARYEENFNSSAKFFLIVNKVKRNFTLSPGIPDSISQNALKFSSSKSSGTSSWNVSSVSVATVIFMMENCTRAKLSLKFCKFLCFFLWFRVGIVCVFLLLMLYSLAVIHSVKIVELFALSLCGRSCIARFQWNSGKWDSISR